MKRFKIIYFISILFLAISNLNSQDLKIAVGQIMCIDSDREGNFVRIENAVIEAKSARADIITFPETSIYGWVNPAAHKEAYPIPGKDSERLCKLAKKYNISICIGLAEREKNKLFDSAILINNKGEIILKHRKINILKELMTPSYSEGSDIKTVVTEFGKIGILICADTFKEDLLQRMKELNPDLLLIPYGWAAAEESWPEHGKQLLKVVQNTAKTVGCTVIGTDLAGKISNGPWTGMTYGGQSVAVDKNGNILGLGMDRDKDIIIVNINNNEWPTSDNNLIPFNNSVIKQWVDSWESYDLNMVDKLFHKNITYFSSEKEGLIKGLENVREHHAGFGFVPGGIKHANKLWLEDIIISDHFNVVIVSAIWYFDKTTDSGNELQKGPVSFVYLKTQDTYKIVHINFSNYMEKEE